jgi:D-amino peptidase
MRIHIITDLEGAAMVFTFAQTRATTGDPLKDKAMRMLTAEVNACVDGILDADATAEVVVWDGHGSGGIDYETFTDKATLVAGKVKAPYGLDETFAALFFVGQHAMAGTPNAPLAHTQSSQTVEYYKLNGQYIGEFHQRAYLAGTVYNVPAAFLAGDDKAVSEAQSLVPELVGVVTKYGLGLEAARSLGPRRAQQLIREGAAEAVRRVRAGRIKPVKVPAPYEFEVRLLPGQEQALERLLGRGFIQVDERTARLVTDDPFQCLY